MTGVQSVEVSIEQVHRIDDGGAPGRSSIAPRTAFTTGSASLPVDAVKRRMPDIDRLLLRTSRTFALAIPQLPDPLRREVGVAYLLFRVADTFEDATRWPRADRLAALADFERLLR